VNILNLCPNTKLVSPVYFGDGVVCPKLSDQKIDIGIKMRANFEINPTQDEFEGALLYKLQRYSDWSNTTALIEVNKKNATNVYMLVAWKVKDSEPLVYVVLVEHTKEFTWNEDELKKLYDKNRNWLKKYYNTLTNTWFMDNNTVLKTTFKVKYLKENFEVNVDISEERDNYAVAPFCINLER
jgi:hypothetical protein